MTMDREKEREVELEMAMYTNCLLLGLDPSILGIGGSNGSSCPRVGLFRHSNPRLGEQLLYFILSALRGPVQSAKDFDKVWPIFDSAQSRDFRKRLPLAAKVWNLDFHHVSLNLIVQGIINELESQGALPRSNSRVSSLATCCGQRSELFVELLWQLSLHALREVHRRTFPADVAANPLPASLTDVSYSHAATLLPVTKVHISSTLFLLGDIELLSDETLVAMLIAPEIAEENKIGIAYLQQELEKLQDVRSKAKLEGEPWDDRISGSLSQNSHLVSKATRLWESLLARKSQHELLASGPIEDLIAHREHRYRISGSSLLAAMEQSSQVPHPDLLAVQSDDLASVHKFDREQIDGSFIHANREKQKNPLELTQFDVNSETPPRMDDRSGRVPTIDIAEVLRRWTHALQRIHKQSLQLAKVNNGEGPDLLRGAGESGTSGHAESLAATLSEHRQHLASIQVFISQLKEVIPAMEEAISHLTEEVRSAASISPTTVYDGRSLSPTQAQGSGRPMDDATDGVSEATSKLSSLQLGKISNSPALKLPPLFNLTPNSTAKAAQAQKRNAVVSQIDQVENLVEMKQLDQPLPNPHGDNSLQESDNSYIQNLRRSVREAALSVQSSSVELLQSINGDSKEHFFVPLSSRGFSHMEAESKLFLNKTRQGQFASSDVLKDGMTENNVNVPSGSMFVKVPNVLKHSNLLYEYDGTENGDFSSVGSDHPADDSLWTFHNSDDAQDTVFSPPLLMDTNFFEDSYEDLLEANVKDCPQFQPGVRQLRGRYQLLTLFKDLG
ncbi:hypothetical protein ACLOJK_012078 [Asimina triloba]